MARYVPGARLSLRDAAKLVAARTRLGDKKKGNLETARKAEDRVRKRIERHAKSGMLPRTPGGAFLFRQLIRWAQGQWPGKFDDIESDGPDGPTERNGTGSAVNRGDVVIGVGTVALPSAAENIARIIDLQGQVNSLREAVAALRKEAEDLRPDAMKYRKNREKNAANGKKRTVRRR